MQLVILVCHLVLILRTEAQIPDPCILSNTNRPPENSDITVVCGTEYMDLSIYICPVYQALYNESLMVLNNQYNKPECFGMADWSVTPPVLKFRFPINESAIISCNNNFKIIDHVGTGLFADFSNVQSVNISGTITSMDPSAGTITYRPQILYKFSCLYPMQYLLNNTKLGVSGVNLAIRDNNGSFISTLSMRLYKDGLYKERLTIPETGLNLKTKIYVAVVATNLTGRFNVLLDRCYATTSPYPTPSTFYDLFVGCTRDPQTKVELNGASQVAHFSFEAFRFVEHKNQTVSTFYLHCITRLCEVSSCSRLLPDCSKRRKREVQEVSENATITSPAISVGKQTTEDAQTFSASYGLPSESNYSSPVVAVIICIIILAIVLVSMATYFVLYIRQKKVIIQ
ncbi:zona pellucida-like domain-containing protein 1 [Acanthopagrus latus]|uniref:zona pellucida-like domain-containing protein 1 n=1 Tax=Acanthopagrus latus TaxID=8177 RepID=UPI00187C6EE5|nr:zona pellucida-like domain-containing protein 1 [Acanthopagrus latus]XP_036932989.1 zona pellucida-like domain-containing protein 1 [Acanthopagrus latus]XP_036932998.1 zona pellucida-like domain-containing protein 1 [Acanthopagrus latus]XP_036933007.1 zona pellucida-like domain-containing protein 1 [Acanthopagrus latus]